MRVREDSNWVKARAACSIPKVFAQLETAVKADVEARNEVGAEMGRFVMRSARESFTVLREDAAGVTSVEFTHDNSSIQVQGKGVNMQAMLTLTDDEVCKFLVDGQELDGWQFRRRALEALFFAT